MSTKSKEMTFIERVGHLVKRDIALKKTMIYAGLSAIVIFLLITKVLLTVFPWIGEPFSPFILSLTFTIGTYAGYAFSSTMFNELNNQGSAPQFLTLPATALEKLTAAWLVSYAAFTIIGLLAWVTLYWIIGSEAYRTSASVTVTEFYTYTATQSIFLFGAVYFKKNNFLATIVSLLTVFLGFSLIVLAINSFFPEVQQGLGLFLISSGWKYVTMIDGLLTSLLISILFLWLAYRKLKNRQIA